jgi:superfamily II DNA helicase RecQ
MSGESEDLSVYEKQRLLNIQRNIEFLATLGFTDVSNTSRLSGTRKESIDLSKPRKEKRHGHSPVQGVRRSKRIQGNIDEQLVEQAKAKEEELETKEDDKGVNYENLPMDPQELDDFEFQVYIMLRKWRLSKCRELDIEPYKIFQNRTLCEAIRIKRNNKSWGSNGASDLTECWGIGPRKVEPEGFAWELLNELESEASTTLLQESRHQ